MSKTKAPTSIELATALCKKFPNSPKRTLARRLFKENPARYSNLEHARRDINYVCGTGSDKHKKWATVPRPPRTTTWKPECPPSSAEPWVPVEIDSPSRVLSLSDMHFPYHDRRAIEEAVDYSIKTYKPNVLLLNGDVGDFFTISRFEKNPKKRDMAGELRTIRDALSWLRGKFPRARRIYKLGNHDERYDKWVWNHAPEFAECEHMQLHEVLQFDKFGFERVDDQPVMAGELPILHGHEFGRSGIAAPVNPARGAFLRTLHTCLVGHLHRTSSHAEGDMFDSEIMAWSQGCLCAKNPEYARINRWNWGFTFVEVARDKTFNVHNHRINKNYTLRAA